MLLVARIRPVQYVIKGRLMNNELEQVFKEAVVA
jgi:hypothetical protein